MSDRTLLMILELAGLNLDSLIQKGGDKDREDRQYDVSDGAATLTRDISSRWKQRRYEVDFRVDGNQFMTFVRDERDESLIKLEERSRGFQWFFSFDLMLMFETEGSFRDCVILLDQLHPLAQFHDGSGPSDLATHLGFLVAGIGQGGSLQDRVQTQPAISQPDYLHSARSPHIEEPNGITLGARNREFTSREKQAFVPFQDDQPRLGKEFSFAIFPEIFAGRINLDHPTFDVVRPDSARAGDDWGTRIVFENQALDLLGCQQLRWRSELPFRRHRRGQWQDSPRRQT